MKQSHVRAPMIAYLYSRWPVVSQTFCDSEMLAHEAAGWPVVVGSLYPPKDSFRHERLARLQAPVFYPPPSPVLKTLQAKAVADGNWPERMIARHLESYGASYQPAVRARNALWLAERLPALGVKHVHVHFANRSTHTALFLKEISGLPFSFTAHAQDFMVDLGNDDLLGEMCREAAFVVAVSDFTLAILREKFPESAGHMRRLYNGLDATSFPAAKTRRDGRFQIVSTGRLIEFKGFHHLIAALGMLVARGEDAELRILGEGPWEEQLKERAREAGVEDRVHFLGSCSQEKVKATLAGADVFALACTVDAKGATDILPTVITEAMACGLPVVSTRLAGVPEMVVHDETGLLAEPGDEKGLAVALQTLADAPEEARAMGDAGRRRAEQVFSLQACAATLRDAISAASPEADAPATPAPESWFMLPTLPTCADDWKQVHAAWAMEQTDRFRLLAVHSPRRVAADQLPCVVDYVPDGIVLEAEWRADAAARQMMEALRHAMGTAIHGETFFLLARRALWMARQADARGIRKLHATGSECAVTAWLAHLLGGVAFTAVLEPKHGLDKRVVARMQECATAMVDAEVEDVLMLADPEPKRHRLGPVRWKERVPPPSASVRREALARFLK